MALLDEHLVQSARDVDIVDLITNSGIALEKSGKDYKGLCPFHSESSPSFTVTPSKNFYYCFGCGASGSPIDFVQSYEGLSFREAVQRLIGHVPSVSAPANKPAKKVVEVKDPRQPIIPVPSDLESGALTKINRKIDGSWRTIECSRTWSYRDASGQLIGHVCRFDMPGGGKEIIPQTFCMNTETGLMSWQWLSFPSPRPVYGLDKIAANPAAQVLVVEGEKAADAGQALFLAAGVPLDRVIVVSWPGGGNAVSKVDWAPLYGRKVGLWPDADSKPYKAPHPQAGELMPMLKQPGMVAMLEVFNQLRDHTHEPIKMILPPDGVPDGWDVADEFPPGLTIAAHARAASMLVTDVIDRFAVAAEAAPEPEEMPWHDTPPPPAPPKAKHEEEDDDLVQNRWFTILGYDGGTYYLFQHEKRQVMSVTKGDLSDIGLIELAPANWWEEHFPGEKGVNRKQAAEWLFRTANARGIYDPSKIRGRGAWRDKGRHVFHHGDYLTVDSERVEIQKMPSAFVYPTARRMPEPSDEPLTDAEGIHLLRVAKLVRWSMPASAALMCGWTMLSVVCGSLKWRPHIWMTGAAGSGKSTIQRDFCSALTLGMSIYAQGNSTEAGIRQRLKADALPVLLDEAECNNEREKQRIENILSLIRQSSSESQAETLKGTVSGDSMNFHIRSMFCLASINTSLVQKADIDRMTKLSIRKPAVSAKDKAEDKWLQLENELVKITRDETLPSRLLARALAMLPTIHANIAVFTRVAAVHFGSQRDGDQFGTLLAGAWSLCSSNEATEADAQKLIDSYDWREHTEDHDQDDAIKALQVILASKIRMPGSLGDITVYELVRETSMSHRDGIVDSLVATATLRRHGIVAEHGEGLLLFGVTTPNLRALVEKTSFSTDLRGQLLRVPGASRYEKMVSFSGEKSRCVSVPLEPILGDARQDSPL